MAMTTAEGGLPGIAHDLYGVAPGEFIATRDARAKRAKTEGDPELAKAIGALRKPSVAAWVINVLIRELPERIGELVALGDEMEDARRDEDTGALRELSRQRRRLTAAVAQEGADLAADRGQKISAAVTEQVQSTLHAAMASENAGQAVRSGVLVSSLAATGLELVDITGALGVPFGVMSGHLASPTTHESAPTDLPARRAAAKAKANREVTDAKAEVTGAEMAAAKTGKTMRAKKAKVRDLQAQVLQLRAELDEVLRQAEALETKLDPLAQNLEAAQTSYAHAEAEDLAAQAAIEKAQRRLTRAREAARR